MQVSETTGIQGKAMEYNREEKIIVLKNKIKIKQRTIETLKEKVKFVSEFSSDSSTSRNYLKLTNEELKLINEFLELWGEME